MIIKKISLCIAMICCLTFIGCSDDDSATDPNIVSSNPEEETQLSASTVSENVSIAGATKNSGNAPSPTGSLPFDIDNTEVSAFLNSGFDVRFPRPDNYAGAYIQFQSNDGTMANEYFDIPANTNTNAQASTQRMSENDEDFIDFEVDFTDGIPPGQFCYLICIYDTSGNISNPEEVCVEVEAWGGNTALTGTWNMDSIRQNGVTTDIEDDEECDAETFFCTNDNTITINNAYCETRISFALTFNSDGTYSFTSNDTHTDIDYQATVESCQAVFMDEQTRTYISGGQWTYDEEEQIITLVEFSYSETEGEETSQGTNEDGELDFTGRLVISGNTLTVTDTETEDGVTITKDFLFSK